MRELQQITKRDQRVNENHVLCFFWKPLDVKGFRSSSKNILNAKKTIIRWTHEEK